MTKIIQINTRPRSGDKERLVRYIRDMSREMAKMANSASLDFLAYLLNLVVSEGERLSNSELPADSENPLQN